MTKSQSLKYLESHGLNVHSYFVPTSFSNLDSYLSKHPMCSVRFDAATLVNDLPFYLFEEYLPDVAQACWNQAEELKCNLICSDGHAYDVFLAYNMSVSLQRDGSFVADVCFENTSLRGMYATGKVVSLCGNIFGEVERKRGILKESLRNILDTAFLAYQHNLFNRLVELSVYNCSVGTLNEPVVFWQI